MQLWILMIEVIRPFAVQSGLGCDEIVSTHRLMVEINFFWRQIKYEANPDLSDCSRL